MTPKWKANELIYKFYKEVDCNKCTSIEWGWITAKQCALIAVDESLLMLEGLHKPEYVSFDIYQPKQYTMEGESDFNGYTMQAYWQEVKNEINNFKAQ